VIWLSWRQQRTETIITAALLALLAAALIPSGIHLAEAYRHDHIAACAGRASQACQITVGTFAAGAGIIRGLAASGWFNVIPGLIGVALATPFLLDLEHGTIRLAWTQSVTRSRWLSTKLGFAVLSAVLAGVAFSALFTWYRAPLDHVFGRFDTSTFDTEGTVPIAYTVFALALAVTIGVLLRRAAAAIVVAFCAFVAARVFVDSWLRQRFVTPLEATWQFNAAGPNLTRAWVLSQQPSDKAGHPVGGNLVRILQCAHIEAHGSKVVDPTCLVRNGAGYTHAIWQPASRFWEFQGIETALFAGIALVLLAAAAAWLVRRAA